MTTRKEIQAQIQEAIYAVTVAKANVNNRKERKNE